MPLFPIESQLVKLLEPGDGGFNPENNECKQDLRTFCQLVDRSMVTRFQIDLTNLGEAELLLDPNFAAVCGVNWTCGGWTIVPPKVEATGVGTIGQTITLTQDEYYCFQFTIENNAESQVIYFQLGADPPIQLVPGGPGTFTAYGQYVGATGPVSFGIGSGATHVQDYEISDVSLLRASRPGVTVRNCDGSNPQEVTDITLMNGLGVPGKALVVVDWNALGLSDGCWELCVADIAEVIASVVDCGDFAPGCAPGTWTITQTGAGWTFGASLADYAAISPSGASIDETMLEELDPDECYHLRFTLAGAAESQPGEFQIQFYVDGQLIHEHTNLGTANGNHDVVVYGASGDGLLISSNEYTDFVLTDLSLKRDELCNVKFCSECFTLSVDHACDGSLIRLTATNTNDFLLSDGVYLDYTILGLTQEALLRGSFRMQDFPYAHEKVFKFSDGDISTQYVDSEEQKALLIQDLPPYMHRAIRLMLVHDTVNLDSERISKVPGPYAPDIAEDSLLSPVIVNCKKYNQRDVNRLC